MAAHCPSRKQIQNSLSGRDVAERLLWGGGRWFFHFLTTYTHFRRRCTERERSNRILGNQEKRREFGRA